MLQLSILIAVGIVSMNSIASAQYQYQMPMNMMLPYNQGVSGNVGYPMLNYGYGQQQPMYMNPYGMSYQTVPGGMNGMYSNVGIPQSQTTTTFEVPVRESIQTVQTNPTGMVPNVGPAATVQSTVVEVERPTPQNGHYEIYQYGRDGLSDDKAKSPARYGPVEITETGEAKSLDPEMLGKYRYGFLRPFTVNKKSHIEIYKYAK